MEKIFLGIKKVMLGDSVDVDDDDCDDEAHVMMTMTYAYDGGDDCNDVATFGYSYALVILIEKMVMMLVVWHFKDHINVLPLNAVITYSSVFSTWRENRKDDLGDVTSAIFLDRQSALTGGNSELLLGESH